MNRFSLPDCRSMCSKRNGQLNLLPKFAHVHILALAAKDAAVPWVEARACNTATPQKAARVSRMFGDSFSTLRCFSQLPFPSAAYWITARVKGTPRVGAPPGPDGKGLAGGW